MRRAALIAALMSIVAGASLVVVRSSPAPQWTPPQVSPELAGVETVKAATLAPPEHTFVARTVDGGTLLLTAGRGEVFSDAPLTPKVLDLGVQQLSDRQKDPGSEPLTPPVYEVKLETVERR